MSEAFFDEYDYYNFEYDKHIFSSHSGKQRTKKEVSQHTNHFDPSGHSRKIVTKNADLMPNDLRTLWRIPEESTGRSSLRSVEQPRKFLLNHCFYYAHYNVRCRRSQTLRSPVRIHR
ncbi:unnamed protein product [Danaus chrysippus]|uniref:(African queen) hypothetical protein n=1 Tax=Danaus chrysippus TaxID=151541 RepID=A0A8J2QFC8_9NEOP|nr:unnamed protein product [Danaus chrysippus]